MTTVAMEGREVRIACEECGAHRVLATAVYRMLMDQDERLTCSTCDTRSAVRGRAARRRAEASGVRLLRDHVRTTVIRP